MNADLFLKKVKVSHFAVSKIRYAVGRERRSLLHKFREIERIENKCPDEIFTVISVSRMQVGQSEFVGEEEGYAWYGKPVQVLVVARSIGRRFKAFESDLTVVEE